MKIRERNRENAQGTGGAEICEFQILHPLLSTWASLVAQVVKNLPAMQETQVRSLGWEDPPLQYSCLETPIDRGAWRVTIPGGRKESDMTEEVTQNHSRPSCQSHHEAHGGVCSEISDFHSRRMGTTQAVEDPDPRQEPRPS